MDLELIIYPTDPALFEKFKKKLSYDFRLEKILSPYLNEDVYLSSINGKSESGICLFYNSKINP